VVSTTYAVITLATEPIGRSAADDLDQRSAPVAAFASSAHADRTPTGPGAAAAVAADGAAAADVLAAARAAEAVMAPAASDAATAHTASRPVIRTKPPLSRSSPVAGKHGRDVLGPRESHHFRDRDLVQPIPGVVGVAMPRRAAR
jgi:hypothetical protein